MNTDGIRRVLRGKVWLVGAGPGDAELLTRKAERLLREADVVAYDELVSEDILALASPEAERIPVGRRALSTGAGCRHHECKIHPVVLERALEGKTVVRLKGGDPSIFGRVGEEAEELAAARIPFEIVPGVSAALGAAARTQIPLTLRQVATSVTFLTAHGAEGSEGEHSTLEGNVPRQGTLVIYMGLARLRETVAHVLATGRPGTTPVAIVSRATTPWEETLEGTLEDIVAKVERDKPKAPALIVVGEVVAHRVRSEATVPRKAAGARGLSDGTDAKPSRSVLEATRASEAPVSEVAWA